MFNQFRRLLCCICLTALVEMFSACSASSSLALASAGETPIAPFSLVWAAATTTSSALGSAGMGKPGTITVTSFGAVSPLTAQLFGTCATISQQELNVVVLDVQTGICGLVVSDGSGQARGLTIDGAPPRTFLTAAPSSPINASGIITLKRGAKISIAISEQLLGKSFGAPYKLRVVGNCVDVAPTLLPAGGSSTVITRDSGSCVVVVWDKAGQAVALNFAIP